MKIHPTSSFAGASYVPEACGCWRQGREPSKPLWRPHRQAHANDWAGNLRGLGYDATRSVTGIEMLQQAISAPRLGLGARR